MTWSTCRPWQDVRADTARIAVGELPRERPQVPAAAGALLGRVRAAEAP